MPNQIVIKWTLTWFIILCNLNLVPHPVKRLQEQLRELSRRIFDSLLQDSVLNLVVIPLYAEIVMLMIGNNFVVKHKSPRVREGS